MSREPGKAVEAEREPSFLPRLAVGGQRAGGGAVARRLARRDVARVRRIERPTYGFYLDHLVDAISTAAIGIGLGLSPLMLLSIGTLIVVAYLILSINVYLESYAFGRFSIGYGLIGPTEVRIILVVLNTVFALRAGLGFTVADLDLTVFDLIGLVIAAGMVVLLLGRAARNLGQLARREPGAPRR
jgi:hypothetical protein